MELHLTYELFKNAYIKYTSLLRDNDKWIAAHQKAVDAVRKNENSGHWEKNFQDKVKALTAIFLDYTERVNKMKGTFEAADEYIGIMYALCKMMPQALRTGQSCADKKVSPSHDDGMELLYDSSKHDLIRDNCIEIDDLSEAEYKLAEEIFNMGERFEFVDFAYINRDIEKLEKGIKKQQHVIPFLECFQAYVQKVTDFNIDISSQFESICGVLPDPGKGDGGDGNDDGDKGGKKPTPKPGRGDDGGIGAGQEGSRRVEEAYDNGGAGYVPGVGAGVGAGAGAGAAVAGAQRTEAFDAAANNLFDRYKNNPDEFMKKYGFPLYDENGNYNYDKLYKDFFSFSSGNGGGLDDYLDAHGDKGAIDTGAGQTPEAPSDKASGSSSQSPKASAKAEEPVKLGLDRSQIV